MDFVALAERCAPSVHPMTMSAIVRVESGFNPYAIGVMGGQLVRQPATAAEATATARALETQGFNFDLGIAQVNRHNLAPYGLTYESAFDACANLHAGAAILSDCYLRATKKVTGEQASLRAALSCYSSGNFSGGFRDGYVTKVVAGPADDKAVSNAIPVVRQALSSHRFAPVSSSKKTASPPPLTGSSESQSALLF